jgi:hypothetical protein
MSYDRVRADVDAKESCNDRLGMYGNYSAVTRLHVDKVDKAKFLIFQSDDVEFSVAGSHRQRAT